MRYIDKTADCISCLDLIYLIPQKLNQKIKSFDESTLNEKIKSSSKRNFTEEIGDLVQKMKDSEIQINNSQNKS